MKRSRGIRIKSQLKSGSTIELDGVSAKTSCEAAGGTFKHPVCTHQGEDYKAAKAILGPVRGGLASNVSSWQRLEITFTGTPQKSCEDAGGSFYKYGDQSRKCILDNKQLYMLGYGFDKV
ncbi:MAG: hypothetical protein AAF614_21475 [Chloroflexota bacterium]